MWQTAGYVAIGLVIVVGLVMAVMGGISRRRSLPCPVWLRWMVEMDNPFTRTNRAAVILEHLRVAEGMTVLDLGCGPGRVAVPAAKAVGPGGQVVAVDLQQGMLNRARAKAEAMGVSNIRFVQAAAGEGKLGCEQFDRAMLVTVLGEIPDAAAALREVRESIKPGGFISITEVIFDPHFQSQSKVRALAEQAGLKQVALFGNRIAYTMHLARG